MGDLVSESSYFLELVLPWSYNSLTTGPLALLNIVFQSLLIISRITGEERMYLSLVIYGVHGTTAF
jgi:hypothetical protein